MSNYKRYTKIDEARAAALYAEHKSCGKVADIMGASLSGIWRALKRAGVAVTSQREFMKVLNADPEFKAAHAARMRALHADPEFKAAHAARMRALHADPEFKAAHTKAASARMKSVWAAAKAATAKVELRDTKEEA